MNLISTKYKIKIPQQNSTSVEETKILELLNTFTFIFFTD